MELALATSRANLASLGPSFRRAEIGLPKGPGPALARPCGVDLAFARLAIEENAVSIVVFDEALADPHRTDIPSLEGSNFQANFLCQFGNISLVDPNETGGTGAAIPASCTLETQALFVPRL